MSRVIFGLYLLVFFAFLIFVHFYFLQGIPHIPDAAAYVMMAKIFASGNIVLSIPYSPEHFNFFPGILDVSQGVWLFQYPFGHPMLLALGQLFGVINIVPPTLGILTLILIYKISKYVYGDNTWIPTVILPAISPFFIFQSVSFMSHVSALFYLTLGVFLITRFLETDQNKNILLYLSGISLGLMANTRPLSALPFVVIFGCVILWKGKDKRSSWVLHYCIGVVQMILLYFLYNFLTTGVLFDIHYYSVNKGIFLQDVSLETLKQAFSNVSVLFRNLTGMLFNWPFAFTYFFLLVPIFLRKTNFWDKIFFVCLFALPLVYFFYNGTFIAYGPRFWYEGILFVFLLTGRGIYLLFAKQRIVVGLLVASLCLFSFYRLMGGLPQTGLDVMSPTKLSDLYTFNYVDDRLLELVNREGVHNAIVFVKPCENGQWWCYGSVFSQNSPFLDGDIVYALDLGDEKNRKFVNFYPGREIYFANYDTLEFLSQ